MSDKKLDWESTYRTRGIAVSNSTTVTVYAGISAPLCIDYRRVASSLQIQVDDKLNTSKASVTINAEQMELLAAHLLEMAAYQRDLESDLAADELRRALSPAAEQVAA